MRPATALICQFIDEEKEVSGVAPICRALSVHGIQIAPRTYWAHRAAAPGKRELWDTAVTEILAGIYEPDGNGRGGVRLIVQPRPPDVGGRGVLEEFFFHGVLVEPGDGGFSRPVIVLSFSKVANGTPGTWCRREAFSLLPDARASRS